MAYGGYRGPNKADKGELGGSCNRSSCQAPNAVYYNHGTRLYYCEDCAYDLNNDKFNKADSMRNYGHDLCTLVEIGVP